MGAPSSLTDLAETVAGLAAAANLGRTAQSLLWGAFDGDDALGRAIDGQRVDPPPAATATARPAPVWLSSVAVEGFRGVGPRAELLLSPQPGLTLVIGRNGSGKSTFAEGLEALLTGDNLRWRDRPKAWQEGWRNLHAEGPTTVSAELQLEGHQGPIELTRTWGDDFDDSTIVGQSGGTGLEPTSLGWQAALTNTKPFLSYNELGSMLEDRPSAIYDSMATVLGLEHLSETRERLRRARLDAERPAKDLTKARRQLQEELATSPDPRATEAAGILAGRSPDLARLDELAFDRSASGTDLAVALSQLPTLDPTRIADRAQDLSAAIEARAGLARTDEARAGRLAALLRQALDHHDHEGDTSCPVCGVGSLDQGWRIRASAEAQALEDDARSLSRADAAVRTTRQAATQTLIPLPASLARSLAPDHHDTDHTPTDEAVLVTTARELAARWEDWVTPPDEGWTDDQLLDRLAGADHLAATVAAVRDQATKTVAASEAEWRPLARQVTTWVEQARAAEQASITARHLRAVESFAKDTEATLRAERFSPIAAASGRLWAQLRQQSNVNLERVTLEGQATTRRVDLDVTVDGTATSALGVMSQGELHALALALFLPRVTTTDSPFRFLVVDDPVQAMDPARVDGLAQVLHQVAADRQVVVFTHDDRLPAACRRLDIAAEIVEISRQTQSRVTVSVSDTPAEKAIDDARALARTRRLPAPLKRQIVPMHCRRALEAQARDLAWPRLLAAGHSPLEIDHLLDEADTTAQTLALLLFGEIRSSDDVYRRLDDLQPGAGKQVSFLNKVTHNPPADLNPEALAGTVRNLMRTLQEWAR